MTTLEVMLLALVGVQSVLMIHALLGIVQVKSTLQKGLDRAEVDRSETVRIPVNAVLACGMSGNLGIYKDRIKTQKELASDAVGHPAVLSRDKRGKL